MPRKKIKWNSEKVISFSAIFISFITLVIFVYQTNLMSKQNYLSILPYVDLSTTDNSERYEFEFVLDNHGIGPAIIESVIVNYKGKQYNLKDYNNDAFQLLKVLHPSFDSIKDFSYSTLDRGIAIPANTKYQVFGVRGSEKDYELLTTGINELLSNGLDYEVVYKSIQNEHWLIHVNSEGPTKLD